MIHATARAILSINITRTAGLTNAPEVARKLSEQFRSIRMLVCVTGIGPLGETA